MATEPRFTNIGTLLAAQVFDKRSRGKGQRNAEAHIGEAELAALLTVAAERGALDQKQRTLLSLTCDCASPPPAPAPPPADGPCSPRRSEFTAWLVANGHANLCPALSGPVPLASRIALLRKANGTEEQVKQLIALWERWQKLDPKPKYKES